MYLAKEIAGERPSTGLAVAGTALRESNIGQRLLEWELLVSVTALVCVPEMRCRSPPPE